MAFCSICSAELMTSYKFCPVCGSNQSLPNSRSSKEPSTSTSTTSKETQAHTFKSTSLGYQELKKEKRASYFRCDKKSKKANVENLEEEVTVNVGVMKYDGLEMKAQRGKTDLTCHLKLERDVERKN